MEYELIYSKRRTLAVQVRADGSLVVRAPFRTPRSYIERFLLERQEWIEETVKKQKEFAGKEKYSEKLSEQERQEKIHEAGRRLAERTACFAAQMGVDYGRITIREQKTRWGSCSAKGNLNYNWKLILMPPEILDYVVVHELAHRREMNHSPRFYAVVAEQLPDYAKRQRWLKEHGREY